MSMSDTRPYVIRSNSRTLLNIDVAGFILNSAVAVMADNLDNAAAQLIHDLGELICLFDVAASRRGFTMGDEGRRGLELFMTARAPAIQ